MTIEPREDSSGKGEYWTSERCFITEFLNSPKYPAVSLAQCRVTPGTTTERHSLSVKEWYIVRSGNGTMHLAGRDDFGIGAGDIVAIDAGTPQSVSNHGGEDLIFECLCMPRFTPDCYQALE